MTTSRGWKRLLLLLLQQFTRAPLLPPPKLMPFICCASSFDLFIFIASSMPRDLAGSGSFHYVADAVRPPVRAELVAERVKSLHALFLLEFFIFLSSAQLSSFKWEKKSLRWQKKKKKGSIFFCLDPTLILLKSEGANCWKQSVYSLSHHKPKYTHTHAHTEAEEKGGVNRGTRSIDIKYSIYSSFLLRCQVLCFFVSSVDLLQCNAMRCARQGVTRFQ